MLEKYKIITTIPVNDLEDAGYFYGKILGLKKTIVHKLGIHYVGDDGGTIALYESPMAGSAQTVIAWWQVEDVAKTVQRLRKRGVVFSLNQDIPYIQSKDGIYDLGGGLRAAWFTDPDGNILGLGNL